MIILPFSFEGYTYKPKFSVQSLSDAFKGIEEDSGITSTWITGY